MTERSVRKYHGMTGVVLSLFILVQVGSGTLIALDEFLGGSRHVHADSLAHDTDHEEDDPAARSDEESIIQVIHHYGERPVQALRVLLGLGVLFMIVSGIRIYVVAHTRRKQPSSS